MAKRRSKSRTGQAPSRRRSGLRPLRTECLEDRRLLAPVQDGNETRVNPVVGNVQRTWFQSPQSVAMDKEGDYAIVFTSYGQDGDAANETNVYVRRYDRNGNSLGTQRVNTTLAGNQAFPEIAMDDDGDFVVTWSGFGNRVGNYDQQGVFMRRFNRNGTPQDPEVRVNTTTLDNQQWSTVALDADGDFVIAWTSNQDAGDNSRGIYMQRYNRDGVRQGGETKVSSFTLRDQQLPTIAMDADGDFVVAWESFYQDFFISWGIYAQRYASTGNTIGGEFRVNVQAIENQRFPSAAMDNDGEFVITWSSNYQDGSAYGVYFRRYNRFGGAITNDVRVNQITPGNQWWSSVAMDDNAEFVVTFTGFNNTISADTLNDVWARQFDAFGNAIDAQFLVNTTIVEDQMFSSIDLLNARCNMVIAWSGEGRRSGSVDRLTNNNEEGGVFFQRYATEPPRISVDSSLRYAPDDEAVVLDSGATVSDPDSVNFNNGQLRVAIVNNGDADDRLSIRNQGTGTGQISVVGGTILFEGVVIGTFVGGDVPANPLIITFNDQATRAAVQATLRNITYENVSGEQLSATRELEILLTDECSNASNTETVRISGTSGGGGGGGGGTGRPPRQIRGLFDFIGALYNDFLGRDAETFEINYWAGEISRGVPYADVVRAFVYSDEHYQYLINGYYQQHLGRAPEPGGLDFWTNVMRAGVTEEQVRAAILGSQEYYDKQGGTDELFIRSLYDETLNRLDVSDAEIAYYQARLNAGVPRADIALNFVTSDEFRSVQIVDDYDLFLRREADAAGLAYWLSVWKATNQHPSVQIGLATSQEYFRPGGSIGDDGQPPNLGSSSTPTA